MYLLRVPLYRQGIRKRQQYLASHNLSRLTASGLARKCVLLSVTDPRVSDRQKKVDRHCLGLVGGADGLCQAPRTQAAGRGGESQSIPTPGASRAQLETLLQQEGDAEDAENDWIAVFLSRTRSTNTTYLLFSFCLEGSRRGAQVCGARRALKPQEGGPHERRGPKGRWEGKKTPKNCSQGPKAVGDKHKRNKATT